MKKLIVVGGGAAGMMAAAAAAGEECQVLLLEKNEKLGKKLYITGKGRCNLTNRCQVEELLQAVCSNRKFLYSAFYGFTAEDTIDFFEKRGLPLKTERGNRVFPVSDHASDVIRTLEKSLREKKVEVRLKAEVSKILTEKRPGEDKPRAAGVCLADGTIEKADALILATGGLFYPSTGSTGDGFRFAREVGHKVTPCFPSLVPLEVREEWVKELQGLSLKNVELTITDGRKELYRGFGEMMFTHFGVTGPLVLTASTLIQKRLSTHPLGLRIDLKPALARERLDQRILREFDQGKNRQFKNVLGGLFPSKLIPVMIRQSGILPEKPVHEITREERQRLVELTKGFPLTVTALRGYNEAVVTRGGVDVREMDPSTMESKKVQNLYFAGEVLDLDALTGGFNLQIAWSTGYAAGRGYREKGGDYEL